MTWYETEVLMEMFKYALQFVGQYWWLWSILTGVALFLVLWQLYHTPYDVLQRRGYHVSAIWPLYACALLTVLAIAAKLVWLFLS